MRRTHHLIASVSVCAVALGLPVCALAQTPGPQPSPADGDMVEEVVVTARGRLEQLKDVAVSASVIDGQALQAAVILNLQDFSTRVPNFRINTSGQSDYIVIRGMGSSANSGFEQSVATFVDGVYRSRSRSSRSTLFDIERVEVLRGPQTTFFGNNAIAGALNIVTRKPSGNFGGNASIYYGEYGEYSVEGGVNLPLTDTLSARVAARTTGMEGYIQNSRPGVGDGPMMQSFNGRFAVAWRPSDNTTVDARLDVGRTHDKNQALVELFNCPPVVGTPRGPCLRYATGVGASAVDDDLDYRTDLGPSLFDLKYEEAVITGKQVFDSFNLTSITGFYQHETRNFIDTVPVPLAYASVTGTTSGLANNYNEEYSQLSQDLRLQTPTDRRIVYTAGAYFASTKGSWDNSSSFNYTRLATSIGRPNDPVAPRVLNTEKSTTVSVFGLAEINVTPKLRADLAMRYSVVEKKAHRLPMVGIGGDVPGKFGTFIRYSPAEEATLMSVIGVDPGDFASPKRTDRKLMPAVSVKYELNDNAMVYASFAKGFKAGGYSVNVSSSAFEPENVDAFEVGAKLSAFDRRLALNVAAFHSKYQDLQVSTTVTLPSGGAGTVVNNAARALSKGIEASVTARPLSGLTLRMDLAYLDSKYESYASAPCTAVQVLERPAPCRQDLSGQPTVFSPKYSGNAGFEYVAPITDAYEVKFGATAYFASEYFIFTLNDPNLMQDAYTKVDARIALRPSDGPWELALIGKNITNTKTVNYGQNASGSTGSYNMLLDPPRTVGVQLSANF